MGTVLVFVFIVVPLLGMLALIAFGAVAMFLAGLVALWALMTGN